MGVGFIVDAAGFNWLSSHEMVNGTQGLLLQKSVRAVVCTTRLPLLAFNVESRDIGFDPRNRDTD